MNCPNCGQVNPESARFCNECGNRLTLPQPEVASAPAMDTSHDFIGREPELGQLRATLEEARNGQGRLVMLVGEPGIGKSRTAEELATYAQSQGTQVLWGRCYEEQGTPPYWPWVQIIRNHLREQAPDQLRADLGSGAGEVAEVVPEIKERLPDLTPPLKLDSPEQARFRLFDAITAFFKNISTRQPQMLVLDDLHWADEPSLLLLQFLTRELGITPLLVLGTYRDVEVSRQHPLSRALGDLTRQRAFQRVLLRGWPPEHVRRFIQQASTLVPPPGLVDLVHRRTEGNPFFVSEVVTLLTEEQGLTGERGQSWNPAEVRVPEGVRDVIGRRLDHLSDRCNQVLTIASVVGREFSLSQLAPLVGDLSEDQLLEVVEEALQAHVIEEQPAAAGQHQFSHALIQETLTQELSLTRRVLLHARIAETLEALYGDLADAHAEELAVHFAGAQTALGTEKLVHYSLVAGERALASYAWEEAEAHFQRGLDAKPASPMDDESAELLFGLCRALVGTATVNQQLEVMEDNVIRLFDYYLREGNASRAVAVAEYPFTFNLGPVQSRMAQAILRALAMVPPDSHQAGRLQARYGTTLGVGADAYEIARSAYENALAIAEREGDKELQVLALTDGCRLEGFNLQYQNCLEKALRAIDLTSTVPDPGTQVPAHHWAATALMIQGNLNEAESVARAMLSPVEKSRHRSLLSIACWTNMPVARMKGDWETAREFISRGLASDPDEIHFHWSRTLIEFETGNFGQGEAYLEELLPKIRSDLRRPLMHVSTLIGLVSRITGETDRLDFARTFAEGVLLRDQNPLMNLTARYALGLAAIAREDAPAAKEQYDAIGLGRVGERFGLMSSDRLFGLLAHTFGDLDQAATHFEDGVKFCRNGYRPELAWTCCDYADTLLRRDQTGDREKARSLLEESISLASELGMRPLMERVQSRLDGLGTPRNTYPDGLTQREVEVLVLIAQGKNNREIGEALVITEATARRHVSNIYDKIGATNRAEATRYVLERGLSLDP